MILKIENLMKKQKNKKIEKIQIQQIKLINQNQRQINLMNRSPSRELGTPMDSLDYHHEQFNRSKHFQPHEAKQELLYKNFYKQQLDDLLAKKNQYKSMQKQKQQQQRRIYNERVRLGQQAQRIKQLSYKNYYQMIMNNQQNIKSKYISPFHQRDQQKDKLIDRGVQVGKVRSQNDYQRQIRRQQNVKKQFQTVLNYQMNQKQQKFKNQYDQKTKTNQYLKNVLLTPQQVERLQRQRKHAQMNKYKEDLDKLKNQKYNLTNSQLQNPQYSPSKTNLKPHNHNILLNPLPFNIQNPYILKQMQRKSTLSYNPSYQTIGEQGSYSPVKRNNIFG